MSRPAAGQPCEDAGDGIEPVWIELPWTVGDVHHLTFEFHQETPRGTATDTLDGKTPVTLTVLETTPDGGWMMEWDQEISVLLDLPEDIDLKELDGGEGFPSILYEVDPTGRFVRITNPLALSDWTTLVLGAMADQAGSQSRKMSQLFSALDRAQLQYWLAHTIDSYHYFSGGCFAPGETVTVTDTLPNQLDGEPFPAEVELLATTGSGDNGLVEIELHHRQLEGDFERIAVAAVTERLGSDYAKDNFILLYVEETRTATYDPATGDLLSAMFERQTGAGKFAAVYTQTIYAGEAATGQP